MSSYTVRDWVTVGLFGGLWGVMELTLGSYLHLIFPSQADTFLVGLVMGAIGVVVALTGRHFVHHRGSVFFISVVTSIIKLLSPGGARLGPVLAILIEGALMEGALWVTRSPHRWAFIVGGALAVGWNLPHKFVMMRLLQGQGFVQVYTKMIEDGSAMLGWDPSAALLILAVLLGARLIAGAIGGWGAWELGSAVARRRGRSSLPASETDL